MMNAKCNMPMKHEYEQDALTTICEHLEGVIYDISALEG